MSEATKKGSLRTVMPEFAAFVDEMRRQFGADSVDAILKKGRAGRGGCYAAEIGPDGVLREFGSTHDGRRCVVEDGQLVWVGKNGLREQRERFAP